MRPCTGGARTFQPYFKGGDSRYSSTLSKWFRAYFAGDVTSAPDLVWISNEWPGEIPQSRLAGGYCRPRELGSRAKPRRESPRAAARTAPPALIETAISTNATPGLSAIGNQIAASAAAAEAVAVMAMLDARQKAAMPRCPRAKASAPRIARKPMTAWHSATTASATHHNFDVIPLSCSATTAVLVRNSRPPERNAKTARFMVLQAGAAVQGRVVALTEAFQSARYHARDFHTKMTLPGAAVPGRRMSRLLRG